jgi:hypothetical protein
MSARVGLDKAGLELGHIEQIGNEPVEALRLLNVVESSSALP